MQRIPRRKKTPHERSIVMVPQKKKKHRKRHQHQQPMGNNSHSSMEWSDNDAASNSDEYSHSSTFSEDGLLDNSNNNERESLLQQPLSHSNNSNISRDLEAGCPTKEEPPMRLKKRKNNTNNNRNSGRTGDGNTSDNDGDDEDDNSDYKQLTSFQKIQADMHRLFETIPTGLKVIMILYTTTCLYATYAVFKYQQHQNGTLCAFFISTMIAASFGVSGGTAVIAGRLANLELEEVLEQEGRSRAILSTLYPKRVLEQMYQEIQPHNVSDDEAAANDNGDNSSDESEENQVNEDLGYNNSTSDTHNSMNSLEDDVIQEDRVLDDTSPMTAPPGEVKITANTAMSPSSSSWMLPNTPNRRPSKAASHAHSDNDADLLCLRRNSLSLRRQSMSLRRHTMGRKCSLSLKRRNSSFGGSTASSAAATNNRPIADIYEPCTVLFADIAGFTAWCSKREPTHVFQLLENVFYAFDTLAKTLQVYKIETIGDCYVAVTGIPNAQDDHAVIMALFASQIILEFDQVVHSLSDDLGADTSTLKLRAGCHSGPVTAGVLRGDKGRFQLFGDTVNTAARMESNGIKGRVHISQEMAHALALGGKSHWYTARPDKIVAKGKGELQTYWLHDDLMGTSPKPSLWMHMEDVMNVQEQRLLEWDIQQLEQVLKKIVAMSGYLNNGNGIDNDSEPLQYEEFDGSILDEVDAPAQFTLPNNSTDGTQPINESEIELPAKVIIELNEFVKAIWSNYNKANPFHSMQHACHVVRSMSQLLVFLESNPYLGRDPMAIFVILLICIVHDLDHPGVSNAQLMQEDAEMADYFNNTCLTEQNALDIAWELLTGETCEHLLSAICGHSQDELARFRKYMVHAMLATDRADLDLLEERNNRWHRAVSLPPAQQSVVLIEQFMQLSSVIHTVQNKEVFDKWNERWFREHYLAYIKGRRDLDPCEHWYKEHIQLFRNDILPLTERYQGGLLGNCDELARQAAQNFKEWTNSGKDIVKQMAQSAKYEFGERKEEAS